MRVALVHDWLTGMRGGEKVLEAVAALFPDAPIFTLLHVRGSVAPALEQRVIHTSFVQHLPGAARHYRQYLPLFPRAIESFNLQGYDLVVSTSHCVAKSVITPEDTFHLCYCHSPMRYAWDQFDAYFGPAEVGRVRSAVMRRLMNRLAKWDAATAGRVDRFVANSQYVAERIRRYYNRGSTVVYPPVDTEFYQPDPARRPDPYFLIVSALVPYKRLDVAIDAARLTGTALRIVGRGPEERRLRARAGAETEFLGWMTDQEIRRLYQGCTAVLMPGVEDFGMVPVEAMACGRPVIALGEGGATESVLDGTTGILVRDRSVDAFAAALRDASTRQFDSDAIRRHAERFSTPRFTKEITEVLDRALTARGRAESRGEAAARTTHSAPPGDEPDSRSPAGRDAAARTTRSASSRDEPDSRSPAVREHKQ